VGKERRGGRSFRRWRATGISHSLTYFSPIYRRGEKEGKKKEAPPESGERREINNTTEDVSKIRIGEREENPWIVDE